ncbi:MAG: sigma-70 factor domain-containing protein, partial [Chloroflexota bacterium]
MSPELEELPVQDETEEEEVIDVSAFLAKARKNKAVDEEELQKVLASLDEEETEELYSELQEIGIDIPSETEEVGDEDFSILQASLASKLDRDAANEITIIDDDPVHTYLREIGRVPLLKAKQEVWLATQLAAAATLEELTEEAGTAAKEKGTFEDKDPYTRVMLHNFLVFENAWMSASAACEVIEVDLPDLEKLIDEAIELRHTWESEMNSYLRHYLNEGEWGQAKEWVELSKQVFVIFNSLYLMMPEILRQLRLYYIKNKDI